MFICKLHEGVFEQHGDKALAQELSEIPAVYKVLKEPVESHQRILGSEVRRRAATRF